MIELVDLGLGLLLVASAGLIVVCAIKIVQNIKKDQCNVYYLFLYILGAAITACIAGVLSRNTVNMKDDTISAIGLTCMFWPVTWIVCGVLLTLCIVFVTPTLLFFLCKGDLNYEIGIVKEWAKTTWNSLSNK